MRKYIWLANFYFRSGLERLTFEEDEIGNGSLVPLQVQTLLVWEFLDLSLHNTNIINNMISQHSVIANIHNN